MRPLTFNENLLLILTIAAVVVAVFLVRFLIQVRRTAREGERTLVELREVAEGLKIIERKVDARVDDIAELLSSSKRTVALLAETSLFLTTKVVRPAARYWPLLYPILRMGWKQLKKKKEK